MVDMTRIETLDKITELQSEYETASAARQKEIDQEIASLGNQLQFPVKRRKINDILAKGRDMTHSDIEHVMQMGATQKDVRDALGINSVTLQRFLNSHRKNKPRPKRTIKIESDRPPVKDLLEQAHSNGIKISLKGMESRLRRMSVEEAVTKPLSVNGTKVAEYALNVKAGSPHSGWF